MNIERVVEPGDGSVWEWKVVGRMGEVLTLPAARSGPFRLGLLGTRNQLKSKKTDRLATMLAGLDVPVAIIDTRRSGAGGSGSWGPLEFGTLIPDMMTRRGSRHPYAYYHLPDLAPRPEFLEAFRRAVKMQDVLSAREIAEVSTRLSGSGDPDAVPPCGWKHWQVFRAAYRRQLPLFAVLVGRALVEAANVADGLAVFLCAEEHMADFESADQQAQDAAYCHRYTLAALIARSLELSFPGTPIQRVCLRVSGEIVEETWQGQRWIAG